MRRPFLFPVLLSHEQGGPLSRIIALCGSHVRVKQMRFRWMMGIVAAFLLVLLALVPLASLTSPATAQQQPPTPLPLYAIPNANFEVAYVSSSIDLLSSDNRTVLVANMLSDSVTILAPAEDRLYGEVPVGDDPRSLAVTPDNRFALVANRMSNSLTVLNLQNLREVTVERTIPLPGTAPVAVVTGDDGIAYVALQLSNRVVGVDIATGEIVMTVEMDAPMPTGLALWGEFLYVTHFNDGTLSLIYLPQERVINTVVTSRDAGLFAGLTIDISRATAYLPQSRLNTGLSSVTYDQIAVPLVNTLNLRDLTIDPLEGQINLSVADRPVSMPFAAAIDRFSQRLYVANAGSNDVSIIDLTTGLARGHIPVGANPRGLVLNADSTRLYVHNALENTLSVIDTSALEVLEVVPVSQLNLSADQLIGQTLFYSAIDPLMSSGNLVSCATCHFDGLDDGRIWAGFSETPRSTPMLLGLPETPPYLWSGAWNELVDLELKIRAWQAGHGLAPDLPVNPTADDIFFGLSPDLDALTAYLNSLRPPVRYAPDSPATGDASRVVQGREIFEAEACASCHVGSAGTDLSSYDVGTGGTFDTPTLRWLWLSAPYLHDGRAATLESVFQQGSTHNLLGRRSLDDISALAAYLLTLPQSE